MFQETGLERSWVNWTVQDSFGPNTDHQQSWQFKAANIAETIVRTPAVYGSWRVRHLVCDTDAEILDQYESSQYIKCKSRKTVILL